jgi:hypothetical protein
VVILASPKTLAHSLKLRLVVMMTLVRSYSLLRRLKIGRHPTLNDLDLCPCLSEHIRCGLRSRHLRMRTAVRGRA